MVSLTYQIIHFKADMCCVFGSCITRHTCWTTYKIPGLVNVKYCNAPARLQVYNIRLGHGRGCLKKNEFCLGVYWCRWWLARGHDNTFYDFAFWENCFLVPIWFCPVCIITSQVRVLKCYFGQNRVCRKYFHKRLSSTNNI